MKLAVIFLGLFFSFAGLARAEEAAAPTQVEKEEVTVTEVHTEKIARVEKMTELPGFLSADKKLIDSIGVETLGDIVTPLIRAGSQAPATASLKLGIIKSCDCAKLKLYRIPQDPAQKPFQLSYDAIRGFSGDDKTVEVLLEATTSSQLKMTVLTPAELEPGKALEWMPAGEMKAVEKDADKKSPEVQSMIQTWKIANHKIDCQGLVPQKCLLIQKADKKDPESFFGRIEGFDYQEGFDYVVQVREVPVRNPPADGPASIYELVKIESQTAAVPEKEAVVSSEPVPSKTEPSAK